MKYQAKWLPNAAQLELLRAALLTGNESISAWRKWQNMVNFEKIDAASYQILPKLYRNLTAHRVDDLILKRYKGTYLRTWTQNQVTLRQLCQITDHLNQRGIEKIVLLKGAAMLLFHYRDFGIRPIGDIDILIPRNLVKQCLQILANLGWNNLLATMTSINNDYINTRHAIALCNQFRSPKFLDVHWHLTPESSGHKIDEKLFSYLDEELYQGTKFYSLDSTHLLLHTCIHGAKVSQIPIIRWVMDSVAILHDPKNSIEWDRLIEEAEKRYSSLTLYFALQYINNHFYVTIPSYVFQALSNIRISIREQREFYLKTWKYTNYIIASAASIWYQHCQNLVNTNLVKRIIKFPNHLKKYWGLPSIFFVPFYISYKVAITVFKR